MTVQISDEHEVRFLRLPGCGGAGALPPSTCSAGIVAREMRVPTKPPVVAAASAILRATDCLRIRRAQCVPRAACPMRMLSQCACTEPTGKELRPSCRPRRMHCACTAVQRREHEAVDTLLVVRRLLASTSVGRCRSRTRAARGGRCRRSSSAPTPTVVPPAGARGGVSSPSFRVRTWAMRRRAQRRANVRSGRTTRVGVSSAGIPRRPDALLHAVRRGRRLHGLGHGAGGARRGGGSMWRLRRSEAAWRRRLGRRSPCRRRQADEAARRHSAVLSSDAWCD